MGIPYPGRRSELLQLAILALVCAAVTAIAAHFFIEFASYPNTRGLDMSATDQILVEDGSGNLSVERVPRFSNEPCNTERERLVYKVAITVVFGPALFLSMLRDALG